LSEAILAVTDPTQEMCYNFREILGLFRYILMAVCGYLFLRKNISPSTFQPKVRIISKSK